MGASQRIIMCKCCLVIDFGDSLIRSGIRQQECEPEMKSDRAAAGSEKNPKYLNHNILTRVHGIGTNIK